MSLWWVAKDQLDNEQIRLIEDLPLQESHLVLGPAGCGKTNVLLRRAQFVRAQNMPNVLVLAFTRSLTEFVRTGCSDAQGREIFPRSCVTTIESWLRRLHVQHSVGLPERRAGEDLTSWKRRLAEGGSALSEVGRVPRYDALFVDEAQDLLEEEVELFSLWSSVLFFVGDDRQKIFPEAEGLSAVRQVVPPEQEHTLRFHYRLAREICRTADRVMLPHGGETLEATCHYSGPLPARVTVEESAAPLTEQLKKATDRLRQQVRVYAEFLESGDRLGVVAARKTDRDWIGACLSEDPEIGDFVQVIRAREPEESDYDPAFEEGGRICVLTVKGCKGLEFRTVHWLCAEELHHHYGDEDYYTVITRAKTSLHIYYDGALPEVLARAHAADGVRPW